MVVEAGAAGAESLTMTEPCLLLAGTSLWVLCTARAIRFTNPPFMGAVVVSGGLGTGIVSIDVRVRVTNVVVKVIVLQGA